MKYQAHYHKQYYKQYNMLKTKVFHKHELQLFYQLINNISTQAEQMKFYKRNQKSSFDF